VARVCAAAGTIPAEAVASTAFPTITSPASASAFSTYASGDLAISASGINPKIYGEVILEQNTAGGDLRQAEAMVSAGSDGVMSTTLSLTAAVDGDAITWRNLRVESKDSERRTMMTSYALGTP